MSCLSSASGGRPEQSVGGKTLFAASGPTGNGPTGNGPGGARQPFTNAGAIVQAQYIPVTPCRVADTRAGGGALVNGAIRSFTIRGASGFAPQGGTSGGCGVPAGASSVTTNVTVTAAANTGYLSGYPAGTVEPHTNFITYPVHQTISGNPTFTLQSAGTEPSLSIRNHGSTTNVIIDITGYYLEPIAGTVNADGSLGTHSSQVMTSGIYATIDTGHYYVQFNQPVIGCVLVATGTVTTTSVSTNFNGFRDYAYVYVRDISTASAPLVDGGFTFTVTC
ncbi:hypothetical protein ABIB25_001603 [Nakamurella sp. UYEF19]|uniref:hypothetical protein n=1 Tax=Nakamurella sp. UYEF19 TaxID=1756392 RepID=UPI0033964FB9